MATRSKALSVRRPRSNESLLLRSAESLGRMIGALQRQLDEATRRLSEFDMSASPSVPTPAADAKTKTKSATKQDRGKTRTATKRARASVAKAAASKTTATARGNGGAVKSRPRKSATKKARPR